jgi:hypothetical protein
VGLGTALGKRQIDIGSVALALTMILVFAVLLAGCAVRRNPRPISQVTVPNDCIVSVAKGDNTECHGDTANSLHCTGIVLVKKAGCETVQIIHKEK